MFALSFSKSDLGSGLKFEAIQILAQFGNKMCSCVPRGVTNMESELFRRWGCSKAQHGVNEIRIAGCGHIGLQQ